MSRPAARHGLLAASLLALPLAQCSSTPPPVTAAPPPVTAPRPPQPVEPMYDLSQVPAPPGLLATVRVGSARGLVRRLAERVGVPDLVTMLDEQLPSAFGDDAAMARVVDLDAPVDVIVYRTSRGREAAVLAVGAVSMPRAEDALAGDHHLAPMSNGARRVQRVERGEACNDEDERVAGGCIRPSAQACALAPAAGGDARAARLVCADRVSDLEEAVAYLTRTLPRAPLTAAEGDLVVDVAAEQLREALAGDARRAAERVADDIAPRPDANHPQLNDLLRAWARAELAPTLERALQDLGAARLALRFTDAGLALRGEVTLRSADAPLVRRALESARDSRLTLDAFNRLPPQGATSYTAGALRFDPFRPELDVLAPALARIATEGQTLPAADVTALRTLLTNVLRAHGATRVQAAAAHGTANNADWMVGVYQLDAPAAPFVADARTGLALLRRPSYARIVRTAFQVNVATVRTPPTPGLPAGSLLVQLPVPANAPLQVRSALRMPTGGSFEALLVPEGNTLWMVTGAGSIARYREVRAAHPPPAPFAGLTEEGVVAAGMTLPTGVAAMLSRIDPQMGRVVERALQRANAGTSPLVGTLRFRGEGAGGTFTAEGSLPNAVLGAVGAAFRQSP